MSDSETEIQTILLPEIKAVKPKKEVSAAKRAASQKNAVKAQEGRKLTAAERAKNKVEDEIALRELIADKKKSKIFGVEPSPIKVSKKTDEESESESDDESEDDQSSSDSSSDEEAEFVLKKKKKSAAKPKAAKAKAVKAPKAVKEPKPKRSAMLEQLEQMAAELKELKREKKRNKVNVYVNQPEPKDKMSKAKEYALLDL